MIFENGKDVSLGQLTSGVVSSSQILYARTNWAGQVDLIVLGDMKSATVYYGRAVIKQDEKVETWVPDDGYEDTDPDKGHGHYVTSSGKTTLEVVYGDGKSVGPFVTGYDVRTGDYVAVTLNSKGTGFASLIKLTELEDVPNSSWSGQSAVTVGGRTYTVPSDVPCYNRSTKRWVTLAAAHGYAETANLYVSGSIVRSLR